jgi:hypothetical protein
MNTIELKLIYDGLEATQHRMAPSLVKQITAGAQEFLGAHAFYYTTGSVPANVNDHSESFRIHDIRQRNGSWEASFVIELQNITSGIVLDCTRELTKNWAANAATLTHFGFFYLVSKSYRAWQTRRPLDQSPFDRVEPVFRDQIGNGAPMFDEFADSERNRQLLFKRVDSSISKITSPIGRNATHVDMSFGGIHLDQHQRKHTAEADITEALSQLGLGRRSGPQARF